MERSVAALAAAAHAVVVALLERWVDTTLARFPPDHDLMHAALWDDPVARQSEARAMLDAMAAALTDLTRAHAAGRFASPRRDPATLTVRLAPPEDEAATSHFLLSRLEIVLQFDPDHAPAALLDRVDARLDGDPPPPGFETWLVGLLAHEYTHLEQALRARIDAADLTYVTIGIAGRARRGKRGGLHRDLSTEASSLRYRGERGEIGAFAAEAAWEIVVAGGATLDESPTVRDYRDLVRRARAGEVACLDPRQVERAWRRFLRKTCAALAAYR